MKWQSKILGGALIMMFAVPVLAQKVEHSPFSFASELAEQGFEPFEVGPSGNASFGMRLGADLYLCFLADNERLRKERVHVIEKVLKDPTLPRELPNIPMACVRVS